jgi:ATP-binding cassette subfamily C protein LapB
MGPALFIEAADRIGLKSQRVDGRPVQDIPAQVLPCLALLKDGTACVLLAREENTVLAWLPATRKKHEATLDEFSKTYSGSIILVKPKPFFIDRELLNPDNPALHWFWGAVHDNRDSYIRVIVASFLINVFALASPVYIMNVYDKVIPNNATETGWALGLGVLIVFVIDFMIRTLRGYFVDYAGKCIDIQVTRRVFDQVLDMKLAHRPASSGAYANMLRDFDSIRDFLTSATLAGLIDLPFALMFVTVIFFLGGNLGLAVLFLMAAALAVSLILQIPLKKFIRQTMHSSETKHGLLVEAIYGLETIKTVGADGRMRSRYAEHVTENAVSGQNSRFYSALGVNTATFIQQAASVFVILIGMYMVQDGSLTMGALIACVVLSGRALTPIAQIANLMSRYHQAISSLKTLNGVMVKPVERPAGKEFLYRPDLKGQISFDRVHFAYPNSDRKILDAVSFSIEDGEKVGIIGRIGSGKSTIARLIVQLYEPDQGAILVDRADYRQLDPADLRRNIAYLGQDVTLFQGTIRENITASRPQASEEDILAAAKAAGAHGFIAAHPLGYDAPVGERGDGLSGGQKQCIALARALLLKPRILLCDEPTNAMDSQSEDNFARLIREESKDRTLILITHRTSLLPLVDRLILIDRGRILMDGARDKVLETIAAGKIEVPR